ncbi:class I SAM-dependent methyltransferase [Fodinicola acaciae]|uniref:class I SAM-dependent methyltransferase n=1 Tax=Fodinicola acaciae TaxID=2681555 RepID=UPI0013D755B1|nr:class I SAM-dependent methyltransferase [Fodinicola acaciae]
MSTIPPSPQLRPHEQRQVAESFGNDADRYDRARPGYPPALVQQILDTSPGRDLLDVGCGTGIAARLFKAAGCRVTGVEPDERMAELARQTGLTVDVTKFEDWNPAGRAYDAVVAAQAWHWVDPVAGAAKAATALRPGGRLAVFWNAMQLPADLNEAVAAVYRQALPDQPMLHRGMPGPEVYQRGCVSAGEAVQKAGGFGEPEQWRFDWSRDYARAEWLDQVPTFGGFSLLPADKQEEILAGIGEAVGDGFTMAYATVAMSAVRIV